MTEQQEKLVTNVNSRLKEASKFWTQACNEYLDSEDFLHCLNVLIQALRNITFILQSNKGAIEGFDQWYTKQQIKMKEDKTLVWLCDARTVVVHVSDLQTQSWTRISVVDWFTHEICQFQVSAFKKHQEIVAELPDVFCSLMLSKFREPLLKIEKRWIVDTLPDHEILEALAHCYVQIKQVCKEAYLQAGINEDDVRKILIDLERESLLGIGLVPEEKRVEYYILKTKQRIEGGFKTLAIDKGNHEEIARHYGLNKKKIIPLKDPNPADPFQRLSDYFETAKAILKKDGHHLPMALICFKEKPPEILATPFTNKTEQYFFIKKIADRILKENITGVIFMLEHWISDIEFVATGKGYPPDDPNKLEAISVTAINKDGKYEMRSQIFHKDQIGNIIFDNEIKSNDLLVANWLNPLVSAWKLKKD